VQIETETFGKDVMKQRDMVATYLQLAYQKKMNDRDTEYLKNTILINEELCKVLGKLPLSTAREVMVNSSNALVTQSKQQLDKMEAPNASELVLALLEEKYVNDTEVLEMAARLERAIKVIDHDRSDPVDEAPEEAAEEATEVEKSDETIDEAEDDVKDNEEESDHITD